MDLGLHGRVALVTGASRESARRQRASSRQRVRASSSRITRTPPRPNSSRPTSARRAFRRGACRSTWATRTTSSARSPSVGTHRWRPRRRGAQRGRERPHAPRDARAGRMGRCRPHEPQRHVLPAARRASYVASRRGGRDGGERRRADGCSASCGIRGCQGGNHQPHEERGAFTGAGHSRELCRAGLTRTSMGERPSPARPTTWWRSCSRGEWPSPRRSRARSCFSRARRRASSTGRRGT